MVFFAFKKLDKFINVHHYILSKGTRNLFLFIFNTNRHNKPGSHWWNKVLFDSDKNNSISVRENLDL